MSLAPFREFPLLKNRQLNASASTGNAVNDAAISGDLSDEGTAQFCLGGALAIGAAALLGPVGLILPVLPLRISDAAWPNGSPVHLGTVCL